MRSELPIQSFSAATCIHAFLVAHMLDFMLLSKLRGSRALDSDLEGPGHWIQTQRLRGLGSRALDSDSEGPGHWIQTQRPRVQGTGFGLRGSRALDSDSESPGHWIQTQRPRVQGTGFRLRGSRALDSDSEGPGHWIQTQRVQGTGFRLGGRGSYSEQSLEMTYQSSTQGKTELHYLFSESFQEVLI